MFLLKRRSDGKFFRNKGYHQDSYWRVQRGEQDPRWVDNPSECKPFATKSGIKNSRGISLGKPPGYPKDLTINSTKEERAAFWQKHSEWYGKKNNKVRREWENKRFAELYEIVEVTYEIRQ